MTEQTFEAPLPRRAYFGAADKQHLADKKISGGPSLHEIEIGRRGKLAATVTARAEDVAGAVKALRAFDATGNTEDALNHLQAALQDLTKAHAILVDDVTDSLGRYRDRRENQEIIADATATRGIRIAEYIPADGVLPAGILAANPAAAAGILAAGPDIYTTGGGAAEALAAAAATAPKPGPRA